MQRVLVVGGAGYIGSHTCKALAEAGVTPIVFDNLSRGRREAVKWGPLAVGDLLDSTALADAFRTYRPEAVIHFAAFAYVGESLLFPSKYYRNNTFGTLNLLDTMRAFSVNSIVFSSTCATYGIAQEVPIHEGSPQLPVNPYGQSKLMSEHVMGDYHAAYGLSFVVLRYFNACGLDGSGQLGVWHDPETRLIPRALMAAASRLEKLEVFGDDYPTPDGTCIRDYVHVSDLADGHVRALKALEGHPGLTTHLNLGTGAGLSVKEVLLAVTQQTGLAVPYIINARRAGDPAILVADPTRAREQLGFVPRHSSIENIIATSWPFFRDRVGHFNSLYS